jgi:2-iminobutanoate/2-iminopropanoate deaminase
VAPKTVSTEGAPAAIGPYSQGVVVGGGRTLYTSGQIALDPESGQLVGGGDVAAEAERVMANLDAVLRAAGMSFADVVRSTIYLADLADFATVNAIYGARFSGPPPARACVQAAALPRGARVEIDVVAVSDT